MRARAELMSASTASKSGTAAESARHRPWLPLQPQDGASDNAERSL